MSSVSEDGASGAAMTVEAAAGRVGWRRIAAGVAAMTLIPVLCGLNVVMMVPAMVVPSFLLYVRRRLSNDLRDVDAETGLRRMFTASQLVCSSTMACLILRFMEMRGSYPQLRGPAVLLSALVMTTLALWLAPQELDDVLTQDPIA